MSWDVSITPQRQSHKMYQWHLKDKVTRCANRYRGLWRQDSSIYYKTCLEIYHIGFPLKFLNTVFVIKNMVVNFQDFVWANTMILMELSVDVMVNHMTLSLKCYLLMLQYILWLCPWVDYLHKSIWLTPTCAHTLILSTHGDTHCRRHIRVLQGVPSLYRHLLD